MCCAPPRHTCHPLKGVWQVWQWGKALKRLTAPPCNAPLSQVWQTQNVVRLPFSGRCEMTSGSTGI